MIDIIYHENYFVKGHNFVPYKSIEYFEFIEYSKMSCMIELPLQSGMSHINYSDDKILDLHILRIYVKSGVCFEYHPVNLNNLYATAKNWNEFDEWNKKISEFRYVLDHKVLSIENNEK